MLVRRSKIVSLFIWNFFNYTFFELFLSIERLWKDSMNHLLEYLIKIIKIILSLQLKFIHL